MNDLPNFDTATNGTGEPVKRTRGRPKGSTNKPGAKKPGRPKTAVRRTSHVPNISEPPTIVPRVIEAVNVIMAMPDDIRKAALQIASGIRK